MTVAVLLSARCGLSRADDPPRVTYNRDIRAILSDKCFRCHGPDAASRQAGLRLDRRDAALAEREGRRAIVPGEPEKSGLWQRITARDPDERMPPADSGLTLSPAEIERLKVWIAQGALYEAHWSFVPPQRAGAPAVNARDWPRDPLDRFILARLEREGLAPAPDADRVTWLRRVTLDLTGLPPAVADIEDFLADRSPAAYEAVVDRLLASPHFGERMALDWLDGARYADTNGFFSDFERPMWPWRDWVIRAFNRNQPFDEFTIEQLAGDLLPEATVEQRIATGFNRNHTVTDETGIIDEEYRVEYVADRLETTGAVWLGLTVGCARCHDHKYDPVSQREYYQLFAFFNQVPETGLAPREPPPLLKLPTPEYERELAARQGARAAREQAFAPFAETLKDDLARWESQAREVLRPVSREALAAEFLFEKSLEDSVAAGGAATSADSPNFDPGVRGTSLKFESPYYAEAAPALTLDSDAPWSISLWASVEGASLACLLSKLTPGDDPRGFEFVWLKGRLKASLVSRRDEDALQVTTRTAAAPNRWNHLAVTYDGSRRASGLKVYVNGQLQELRIDRDTLSGPIANDVSWKLGRNEAGLGFTGRIDQLRFYRRVLAEDEIARALFEGEEITGIIETEAAQRSAAQQDRLKDYFIRQHAPAEVRAAWIEMLAAQKADADWAAAVPRTLVMEDQAQPRETFVLARGQYDQRLEKVEAQVPAVLPRLPEGASRNRLGFARWLVQPDHPLMARVIVNRYWTLLFGEGLVKTANDFGAQGEPPSHPELLDTLAVEFRESGWNLKALLRQIVLSATYRQAAVVRPGLYARDPENRLLARGPRFRLPGELIRDQALAASGLLVPQVGGASVKPYQPPGLWEAVSYDGDLTYVEDQGAALYRRSLYTFWKRQAPPPALISFDSPTRETCAVKRPRTNTPLQALVLLNDPTYVEAARVLAARNLALAAAPVDQIRHAFRQVTGRWPEPAEVGSLVALYERQLAEYDRHSAKAEALLAVGASPVDASLDRRKLAALTAVASVIFNLDEVITRP